MYFVHEELCVDRFDYGPIDKKGLGLKIHLTWRIDITRRNVHERDILLNGNWNRGCLQI
jgi:hypothetical protein